jgi:hypothetical protein
MPPFHTALARLQANWVYGGALAGLLLLALTPLFAGNWTRAELLVFLTLPAYMLKSSKNMTPTGSAFL